MHRNGVPDFLDSAIEKATFSGFIREIDILDYVQLLMLTCRQVVVEVRSRKGQEGKLFISQGRVCHAICGDLEGEEAIYECLGFAGGSFVDLEWTEPEKITVNRPGEFLLLEAAHRRDDKREEDESENMPEDLSPVHTEPLDLKLTVLLIDDMRPLVAVINDGLKAYGHKVIPAFSGRHGLEILKNMPVDLVISELTMSDMTGWQVGKAIRAGCEDRGRSKTPFIILTGSLVQPDGKEKIVESGVDYIIQKPVNINWLDEIVRKVFQEGQRKRNLLHDLTESQFEVCAIGGRPGSEKGFITREPITGASENCLVTGSRL